MVTGEHCNLKKRGNWQSKDFWGWVFLPPTHLKHKAAMQSHLQPTMSVCVHPGWFSAAAETCWRALRFCSAAVSGPLARRM